MSMNINPGNFGGLASLAGTRVGNLGLQSPADAYLKARGQTLQHEIQQRQLGQQSIQNFVDGQRADKQAGLDQSNKDRQFGLQEKQLSEQSSERKERSDLYRRQVQANLDKLAMDSAQQESSQKLQASQIASFTIASMNPKEWEDNKVGTINSLVVSGLLDKDQGKQFIEMDHSQIVRSAKALAYISGKAKDFQSLTGQQSSSGGMKVYDEQGQLRYESQGLTSSTKTNQQKELLGLEKDYNALLSIENKFNDTYLTTKGQQDMWASQKAERLEKYPIIGPAANMAAGAFTGRNAKERSQYIMEGTEFLNQTEQFFQRYRKRITGAQAALQELAQLRAKFLSGDMSPSQFKGALNAIKGSALSDMDFYKQSLQQGVEVTPSAKTATEEGIQSTLQQNPGMTREQLIPILKQKGYTIEGTQ